jgi:hypothetical protein
VNQTVDSAYQLALDCETVGASNQYWKIMEDRFNCGSL